jgi:hypothetical protein
MDKMLIPQWKRLARDLWQSERTLVISCFAKEVLKKYCTYPKKNHPFLPCESRGSHAGTPKYWDSSSSGFELN